MKLILLIELGKEGMATIRTLQKEIAMHCHNITHQSAYPESRCTTDEQQFTLRETGSLFQRVWDPAAETLHFDCRLSERTHRKKNRLKNKRDQPVDRKTIPTNYRK
jgi:hypothetical protein